MSSESIASPPSPVGTPEPCRGCGAPLADDQRYCLECGERRTPMSSVLLGAAPGAEATGQAPPSAPPGAPIPPRGRDDGEGRGSAVTVIAGVGVLLLAMGIGVLIGRSGGGKQATSPPPQVITVAGAGGATSSGASGEAAAFTGDWPSGTNGYTVQLQTLPSASTQPSAVEAAKTAASGKGAKEVGALKSEEFSSLVAGNYVIYAGVYHKRAEAQKALPGLKKSFPAATVVHVSSGASTSTPAAGSGSSTAPAAGGSGGKVDLNHPAPPAAAKGLNEAKGKSYEEKSKNLPDVISTG